MIVGGRSSMSDTSEMNTEICEHLDGELTCSNQKLALKQYYNYPLLLVVEDEFKNC